MTCMGLWNSLCQWKSKQVWWLIKLRPLSSLLSVFLILQKYLPCWIYFGKWKDVFTYSLSFLSTEMTNVVEILPVGRQRAGSNLYLLLLSPVYLEFYLTSLGTMYYSILNNLMHGPLTRYVKLRVAHALGLPGTLSPPPTWKETAG